MVDQRGLIGIVELSEQLQHLLAAFIGLHKVAEQLVNHGQVDQRHTQALWIVNCMMNLLCLFEISARRGQLLLLLTAPTQAIERFAFTGPMPLLAIKRKGLCVVSAGLHKVMARLLGIGQPHVQIRCN